MKWGLSEFEINDNDDPVITPRTGWRRCDESIRTRIEHQRNGYFNASNPNNSLTIVDILLMRWFVCLCNEWDVAMFDDDVSSWPKQLRRIEVVSLFRPPPASTADEFPFTRHSACIMRESRYFTRVTKREGHPILSRSITKANKAQ